jgi:eukaryotic-like serine/threonine-protein kinase
MTGRTLAHYQIVEKLGEGGMGVVWKARDTHLDRFVALKLLPAEKLADPERKRRFVQEAKSASALNHPNIIHIYDISEAEGMPFLAMEYVAGKTLSVLIGRKGLQLQDALKYAIQIVDALAKAHSAGIVHRDLKPSNIMVTDDGLVKVLDFGLAKLTEQSLTYESADTRTLRQEAAQTEEGVIVGTPAYMSPEQAEGKPVDARSDIFSFGAVLYEMLSGRRAFHGDTPISTLAQVLNQEPVPLHEISPAIPVELERLVARCLRKDPERRLRSMADLKVALEELKEESESGSLPSPVIVAKPRAGSKWWWVAAVVISVFAGGLLWFLRPLSRIQESSLKEVPLTSYLGSENAPSFSPDGNQIAFSWSGEKQDNNDIYVKLVGPGAPLRLTTNPSDDNWPAWSPDGRTIAFLRDFGTGKFGVFLIPALGGPERKLLDVFIPEAEWLPGPYLAWQSDSRAIIFTHKDSPERSSSLFVQRIDSQDKRQITFPPAGAMGDSSPALSADGSALVFSRMKGVGPADLHLLPLGKDSSPSGEPRQITFFNWQGAGAAWTPDGRAIVYSYDGKLWKIIVPRFGNPSGPQRIESIGNGGTFPTISGHGRRLAYVADSSGPLNIWRVAIPDWSKSARKTNATNIPASLIPSTRTEFAPQYSPDGKKIAFESDRSGALEIWACDSDGSNCVQLTSLGAQATGVPYWSPDGQRIVFYSRPQSKAQIYVINAEGGAVQRLLNDQWENFFPVWSRDGRWIYFASNRSGTDQIWKMPSSGGTPIQVTKNGGFKCAESSDSKYLYYTRSKDPSGSVWKMVIEGGPETRVLESVVQFNFAVTTRGVYFMTQPDPRVSTRFIQFLGFADQTTRLIAAIKQDVYHGFSVSPDERWLAYAPSGPGGSNVMMVENFD